jgi:hypothetical protein
MEISEWVATGFLVLVISVSISRILDSGEIIFLEQKMENYSNSLLHHDPDLI